MKYLVQIIYNSYNKNHFSKKGNKSLLVKVHTFIFSSSFIIRLFFGVKINDSLHLRTYPHKFDLTTILLKNYLKKIIVKRNSKVKVLEIGTGYYGILSIFLKRKLNVDIIATDLDPKAIESTKLNLELNNVKIETFASNLFENINSCDYFDIIFWNLPYYRDKNDYLKRLIDQADKFLGKDGKLILGYNSTPLDYDEVRAMTKINKKLIYDDTILYPWNRHAISVIKKSSVVAEEGFEPPTSGL